MKIPKVENLVSDPL